MISICMFQVHNRLHLSLEMLYKLSENASTPYGHVEPGAIYCLPCESFRLPNEVYFRPSQEGLFELLPDYLLGETVFDVTSCFKIGSLH